MLRRIAVLAVLVAVAGLTTVALSGPAVAAGITSSVISTPATGTHFLVTDAQPATTVTVTGSTSGGAAGDLVDIRCYDTPGDWQTLNTLTGVPLDSGGNFSAQLPTDVPWGSCALRAVPHGYPANGSLAAFNGPTVTTESVQARKILTGPYTGMVDDYYVEFVSAHAMSDFHSATSVAFEDARLQYADGTSSNVLWNVAAALQGNEGGVRSSLRVDGHNAYGPFSAAHLYPGSNAIPGLPALTFSASRNATTGTITIHETDPIVVCPSETYPPTDASCPQFTGAGVRRVRVVAS